MKQLVVHLFTALIFIILIELTAVWLTEQGLDLTLSTEYTKEFSIQNFKSIHHDMDLKKAENILGQPFERIGPQTNPGMQYECDLYSRSKKANDFIRLIWFPSTSWVSVRVCYDEQGKVAGTYYWVFSN
jgi:hypothetical protein